MAEEVDSEALAEEDKHLGEIGHEGHHGKSHEEALAGRV
jgi:hypothetical protein